MIGVCCLARRQFVFPFFQAAVCLSKRNMSVKDSDHVSSWKPSKARYEFRTNPDLKGVTSGGFCMGYLQANMTMLPSSLADDFEQFCALNEAACPVIYRSKIGEVSAGHLAPDSDIRTDLAKYCVNKNGLITEQPGELTAYPWDDIVSFYIGCTFAFEAKLIAAGIPIKSVTEKRCVSMFPTNIQCVPVGPFASPLVVSMRPIPKDMVEKTLIITAAYEAVHGAPVHIGDPSVIGIEDLYNTEFGEPSDIGDLIPVFWACGRSSSIAVRAAKLPLSFCHFPGSTFICDASVDEYFKVHKPQHGDEQPRLITLTDQPYLASVCSASAIQKIEEIAKLSASPSSAEGTEDPQVAREFLKIALRLSHAPSVVIGFLHEKESFSSEMSTSECTQAMLALVKALQALNKKITIVTQHNARLIQHSVTANAAQGEISNDGLCVVEYDHEERFNLLEKLYKGETNYRLDTMMGLEVTKSQFSERNNIEDSMVDTLFKEVDINNGLVSIKITADKCKMPEGSSSLDSHTMTTSSLTVAGCGLAAALYALNKCPIHSRYVRRGTGKRPAFQAEQFILNAVEDGVSSQIVQKIADN